MLPGSPGHALHPSAQVPVTCERLGRPKPPPADDDDDDDDVSLDGDDAAVDLGKSPLQLARDKYGDKWRSLDAEARLVLPPNASESRRHPL